MTQKPSESEIEAMISNASAEAPSAEFRMQIKRSFVTGDFDERAVPQRRRRIDRAAPRWRASQNAFIAAGLSLAAAACVLVMLSSLGDESSVDQGGPANDVAVNEPVVPVVVPEPDAPVVAQVDDIAAPDGVTWQLRSRSADPGFDVDAMQQSFLAGDAVASGMVTFDLVSSDGLSLRLLPGTEVRAETLTDDRDESFAFEVTMGELLISTPRDYAGSPMSFATAHSDVRVTGTALGIMASADGTCVCVSHGSVEVTDRASSDVHSVVDDETCFVFAADIPTFLGTSRAFLGDYEPIHRASLLDFDGR